MNTTAKVAAAVASGYLLGRTKKLKLAIAVGGLLAGKRIATDPRAIVQQLADVVEQNPELSRLSDQVRGKLVTAGREAAVAAASNRLNRVSDSIRDRTDRMLSAGSRQDEDEAGTEDEERPRRRTRPGRRAEGPREHRRSRDEEGAGSSSTRRSSRSSAGEGSRRTGERTAARAESDNGSGSSTRKSATAKKTASKSTSPARKSAAKKTTAKKSTSPAKKTAAKKTAAKKSAAKKSTSRSAGGSSARKRG
jgi:hypothetical protein